MKKSVRRVTQSSHLNLLASGLFVFIAETGFHECWHRCPFVSVTFGSVNRPTNEKATEISTSLQSTTYNMEDISVVKSSMVDGTGKTPLSIILFTHSIPRKRHFIGNEVVQQLD